MQKNVGPLRKGLCVISLLREMAFVLILRTEATEESFLRGKRMTHRLFLYVETWPVSLYMHYVDRTVVLRRLSFLCILPGSTLDSQDTLNDTYQCQHRVRTYWKQRPIVVPNAFVGW